MKKITVLIAGLSKDKNKGKMARMAFEAIIAQPDMTLSIYALSEDSGVVENDFIFVPLGEHEEFLAHYNDADFIVDFTQPNAVNRNAELYCKAGMPFVMGTTGGNRQKLLETVQNSKISAVIAPNMAVPVVIIQEMFKFVASEFPGALEGWKLLVEESHQATKKDFSGTAISLMDYFSKLGMPEASFTHMERDPVVQEVKLGIPKEYISGHGYHTYIMISPDGTVELSFTHNVRGRNVYVDGVLRAIRFLVKHKDTQGQVFSMADVLHG